MKRMALFCSCPYFQEKDFRDNHQTPFQPCRLYPWIRFMFFLTVHLDIIVQRQTNLTHNLFLVYFVNLYMFLACLGPSSGGTTTCIQQLVLIILLDDCLLSWLDWTTSTRFRHIQAHHQELQPYVYNNWYLLFFQVTVCCPGLIGQPSSKRIISTSCCVHTVVPPDDGPRYARNVQRLTKYSKNKLCIKLVFLHTMVYCC